MKTLRQIMVIGLLFGSYQVGIAQNMGTTGLEKERAKQAALKADAQKADELKLNAKQETLEIHEWEGQNHPALQNSTQPKNAEASTKESTKLAQKNAEALQADQRKANSKQESVKVNTWNGQNHPALNNSHTVKSQEKFASEADKKAWIESTKKSSDQ